MIEKSKECDICVRCDVISFSYFQYLSLYLNDIFSAPRNNTISAEDCYIAIKVLCTYVF